MGAATVTVVAATAAVVTAVVAIDSCSRKFNFRRFLSSPSVVQLFNTKVQLKMIALQDTSSPSSAQATPILDSVADGVRQTLTRLAVIADAYDANALDDEARKYWGESPVQYNQQPHEQIELYQGRGGKQLLTLADCMKARELLRALDQIGGLPQQVLRKPAGSSISQTRLYNDLGLIANDFKVLDEALAAQQLSIEEMMLKIPALIFRVTRLINSVQLESARGTVLLGEEALNLLVAVESTAWLYLNASRKPRDARLPGLLGQLVTEVVEMR